MSGMAVSSYLVTLRFDLGEVFVQAIVKYHTDAPVLSRDRDFFFLLRPKERHKGDLSDSCPFI